MKKALVLGSLLLGGILLTGCGQSNKGDAKGNGTVNLEWYYTGIPQKDLKVVNEEVNKYTKDKYNITVTLNQIDWGEYDQKMSALVNAGEKFDLAFSCSWLGGFNYLNNSRKGAFLDITEYLEEDNKELKDAIYENFWKGATIDGKIYGVPAQKEIAATEYYVYNKELVDKYDVPYQDIRTYDDLEPWLELVKEKENIEPWFMGEAYKNPYEFDDLSNNIGLDLKADQDKIVNYFFEDPYIQRITKVREFMEKGYINKDAALAKGEDIQGRDWLVTSMQMGPLDTATAKDSVKKDVVISPMMDSVVTNASTMGGGTVISANTDHPKEAVKFLEAVNTDPKLMNLLAYGIEGKHYEKTGDDTIKWLDAHSNYTNPFYMFGNYFNLYHQEGAQTDEWEVLAQYNKDATPSPALGFNFDTKNVTTQLAAMNNVVEEFKALINTGSVDVDKTLADMKKKMDAAGQGEIIEEMQKQYDEWKKAQ